MERKLASIQKIVGKTEIPGAENIEIVHVLGWQCVAQKNEFAIGDLCVYFEIDSILPVHPVFFFMEHRKYRVRTIKLMKQLSQGLALPISIIEEFIVPKGFKIEEDVDVTDIIGIKKYEPHPDQVDPEQVRTHNKYVKYFMKYAAFRAVYWFIFPRKTKGNWPSFIQKTDEIRLQACPSILYRNEGKSFYATEKIDGSSATYFYNRKLDKKRFGFIPVDKGNGFGVCSRNLRLVNHQNDIWWEMAIENDIENKLRQFCKVNKRSIAIQGEVIGPKANGNKYNLKKHYFWCFNIYDIDKQAPVTYAERIVICKLINIPVLEYIDVFVLENKNVQWFLDFSNRKSFVNSKALAEGIVCRCIEDDNISFKVINPDFLLKHKE